MSKIEIALELFCSIFLGWQSLEKGVLKLVIALGFFDFFYGWQPLGGGILKVEIALELFLFLFLGGNSGKKRVLEI